MAKTKKTRAVTVPTAAIQQKIYLIRGIKVMLDQDLAEMYGVSTGRLNEQVKRNIDRFPEDFMFQLTKDEHDSLRSQFATLKKGRGEHRKYPPYAFTEQGVAMLSSVLNSKRAIQVNIQIMRVFTKLREVLSVHRELLSKIDTIGKQVAEHDKQIVVIFDAIKQLLNPKVKPPKKRQIGY